MTDTNNGRATAPDLSPRNGAPTTVRVISATAMLIAIASGTMLGVRTISSFDIGYHLSYGDQFLQTFRPVDGSSEVYTLQDSPPPGDTELPPACWWDAEGRFRFPNANWGSQIIFSLVHRLGGMVALSIFQACVVLGIFIISAVTMRRGGLEWGWIAAAVLLIAMTGYERFILRPELLAYLVLAVQLCLLAPLALRGKPLSWRAVIALAMLQLLLVNLHSYWMLGLALTAGVLGEELLRMGWNLAKRTASKNAPLPRGREVRLMAILLAAQVGLCFVNPWTWRLAALPFQTLLFFGRHQITTVGLQSGGHAWSIIGEFFPSLDSGFRGLVATYAYYVVLALGAVGIVAAAIRRKWASLFLVAGFLGVSFSMRRNIAPGAILIVPLALAVVVSSGKALPGRDRLSRSIFSLSLPCAVAILSVALGWLVATNRFYFYEHRADRFGLGVSKLNVPTEAGRWLSEHNPRGRLWTDYDASSNLYYLTRPHPNIPILTNTWAYPPAVMAEVLDYTRGVRPFSEAVEKYGIEAVAIRVNRMTAEPDRRYPNRIPLALALSADPHWSLVHLDALHAIFLRNAGPNAAAARQFAISPETLDLELHAAALRRLDPLPEYALYQGGKTLSLLGWNDRAIPLFRAAIEEYPSYKEPWYDMGVCYARMGMQYRSRDHYIEARNCFLRCLEIEPTFTPAQQYLRHVNEVLKRLRKTLSPSLIENTSARK